MTPTTDMLAGQWSGTGATRNAYAPVLSLVAIALCLVASAGAQPATKAPAKAAAELGLPESPKPGATYPVRLDAANRGVRVTVYNAAVLPEYGNHKAPEGGSLLVLSSEWENVIPLTLIDGRNIGTAYKIPNLADHVYVVLDGRRTLRLDPKARELPGHVPVTDFVLERIGSRLRGNLVFVLPPGGSGAPPSCATTTTRTGTTPCRSRRPRPWRSPGRVNRPNPSRRRA